jgi:hypothetical protein
LSGTTVQTPLVSATTVRATMVSATNISATLVTAATVSTTVLRRPLLAAPPFSCTAAVNGSQYTTAAGDICTCVGTSWLSPFRVVGVLQACI